MHADKECDFSYFLIFKSTSITLIIGFTKWLNCVKAVLMTMEDLKTIDDFLVISIILGFQIYWYCRTSVCYKQGLCHHLLKYSTDKFFKNTSDMFVRDVNSVWKKPRFQFVCQIMISLALFSSNQFYCHVTRDFNMTLPLLIASNIKTSVSQQVSRVDLLFGRLDLSYSIKIIIYRPPNYL